MHDRLSDFQDCIQNQLLICEKRHTWIIRIVDALGWQSTPCCSSFSRVATSTCSISTVNIPHLTTKN